MKPYIIGICGGSGSGKTSFIDELRAHFSMREVCVLSQDNYYRPIEAQQLDDQGIHNFDLPAAFDNDSFLEDIKRLINGETVEVREYIFNNVHAQPRTLVFQPAPVLVVEGIFIFHERLIKELLTLKIFIHTKDNLKIIRRIKRDRRERNYPVDDVLYRFEHHITPAYERYIRPYYEEADLIILNNRTFQNGLQVILGFLENHLGQFKS